jgi:DNA-binding NarL/FixJ family response regulator
MKILVLDDHVAIREGMHSVLKAARADAVVLEASDCGQAMHLIAKEPDIALVLLDLGLPDRDGFSMLTELRTQHPEISVVVMSGRQDRENVVKALDLGAMGFIPKSGRREVMLGALQLIFAGGIYIPPEILESPELPASVQVPLNGDQSRVSPTEMGLTDRQLDVLALIVQGKNNKLICRSLNLAESTVKNCVSGIFKALKVTNRTEAVLAVHALGWKLPTKPES